MKPILDKDFDKIFHQKFEAFEFEPSNKVWEGIKSEINEKGKERNDTGFILKVAASVVVFVTAGLFVAPKSQKVWLQKEETTLVSKEIKPSVPAKENQKQTELAASFERPVVPPLAATDKEPTRVKQDELKSDRIPEPKVEEPVSLAATPETRSNKESELKSFSNPKEEVVSVSSEGDALIAMVDPEEPVIEEMERDKSNIKSIGGLVNFVVGKVDRRSDKIIEFKDTDEGSLVSGINLGFVKIKSRK